MKAFTTQAEPMIVPSVPSSGATSRSRWHRSAVIGGAAWVLALATAAATGRLIPWLDSLAPALFLLAPLVLVPLGLGVVATPERQARNLGLWQAAARLQLPAALILLGSFALPAGGLAAGLAVLWLIFTSLIALLGLLDLRRREEWCVNAGLIYLAVGGAWATLSRLGMQPLGFSHLIVLATAIHFHYAGFVLPLLAGLAGRELRDRTSRLAAAGVVVGVPLVAAGITLSAFDNFLLEWLASWLLAAVCLVVAALQLRLAFRAARPACRLLFAVSGLSLFAAMLLAAVYGLGRYCGVLWLDIPQMLPLHGAVNALGFALPGLLAWTLLERREQRMQLVLRFLGQRPRLDEWEAAPFWPGVDLPPGPGDYRDVHEREVAAEGPGEPAAHGPFRRLADAVLGFDVFPPGLVTAVLRRKPVDVGDTVGVCYHFLPGLDLFFAARVVDRFDGPAGPLWRTGFTYRTLRGHPELGEETFCVEKDLATGRVRVALRSWSRRAMWLARAAGPVGRRLQLQAGRAALDHLEHIAKSHR
jgi:uncharacterized protein (UPF0548 family)